MIPKIIHQIWEGRTEYLGDAYKLLGETWKEHHPDWKYEFWDESRIVDFIYDYYPEMIDIYFGYQYNVQRWHVIRYLILYKIGGLYVDFDYECLESFDRYILDGSKCHFASEPEGHYRFCNKVPYINNALIITPPNHPFFINIIVHLQTTPIFYTGNKYQDVLNTTGASMLTNLYENYHNKDTVDILPAELVSPFSREEVKNYIHGKADEKILEKKLQNAIAIHYFLGSWLIKNNDYLPQKNRLSYMPISELYQIFKEYPVICTDSQISLPNSLFFAVKTYSYDGNKFAQKALDAGCRYAVVDNPMVITNNLYILVDDVLQTLEQLAKIHHKILKTPVIGITGTCGKTTTKDLITAVLSTKYNLVSTKGSENASLGASLTLLRLKPEHTVAIIEMGACCPRMIRELARIIQPCYGIITNVGLAHLKGFGSLAGVIRSKGELYDYLRQFGGKIFIHKENTHLQSIARGLEQISYGESKDAFVSGRMISSEPCLCFNWENAGVGYTISTHMAGNYNLWNALAAIAVGLHFDIPCSEINRVISDYIPTNHRSQWKKTLRNELIIDTFNANPCSMHAALASFSTLKAKPKAVILGDMLGLGINSLQYHAEIIEALNRYGFEKILLCGDQFTAVSSIYQCFLDVEALYRYLSTNPLQGYEILIKGSNRIHLETIIHLL